MVAELPRIDAGTDSSFGRILGVLDRLAPAGRVDKAPWGPTPGDPSVWFSAAVGADALYVVFRVREARLLAACTEPNAPVWQDSCVELFLAPVSDGLYYNFEFNGIGACLAEVGRERGGRDRLPEPLVRSIRRSATLGPLPIAPERTGEWAWRLAVELPAELFVCHPGPWMHDARVRANFYKCGDGLSRPHYLCWNPVVASHPDFHRPECFGELVLPA